MIYIPVVISVTAMSAAQLLLKKGLLVVGQFPEQLGDLPGFFMKAFINPYVVGAGVLTIITALAWFLAVSRAELSQVYPFMALSYVLVALFSLLIFKEDVNALRWVGVVVICIGVVLVSRS